MGASLAHGVSKRRIRDGMNDWQEKIDTLLEKHRPGKAKRAAIFRAWRKVLTEIYKDRIIYKLNNGRQDGKDKKASHWLLVWDPCTVDRENKEELVILFSSIKLKARNADPEDHEIAEMTTHCLARLYQTYHIDNFEQFVETEKTYLAVLLILKMMFVTGELDASDTYALTTTKGIILFGFIQETMTIQLKTIISFEAMSPSKAEWIKNKINKDEYFFKWHSQI